MPIPPQANASTPSRCSSLSLILNSTHPEKLLVRISNFFFSLGGQDFGSRLLAAGLLPVISPTPRKKKRRADGGGAAPHSRPRPRPPRRRSKSRVMRGQPGKKRGPPSRGATLSHFFHEPGAQGEMEKLLLTCACFFPQFPSSAYHNGGDAVFFGV